MTDQVAGNGLLNRRTLLSGLAKGSAVVSGGLLLPGAAPVPGTGAGRRYFPGQTVSAPTASALPLGW